jgi:hypothetical protein
MDRIVEVAEIVNSLGIKSLLDVGCRDIVLKSKISTEIRYAGNDLFQNKTNSVTYVGDILHIDIPDNSYECVTALDILEHTDDPYTIFNKLDKITSSYLIINLPNCYDLKSIYKFIVQGQLGGKYKFGVTNQLDRHRWLMNYTEIKDFYTFKAKELDYSLTIIPLLYGQSNNTIISKLGTLLSFIMPKRLTTASIVGVFKKKEIQ